MLGCFFALAAREADLRELNGGLENEVLERTGELRAAEAALCELNEGLEHEVQERTRELLAVADALRQSQKTEEVGSSQADWLTISTTCSLGSHGSNRRI